MKTYEELRQAAESGKSEDINALGRWFEREGREYWNGECYDADGMEIYPVYKLVDAETEDYEIVGYTTDKGEMFVKVYKVKPEYWSAWGENVDENTIVDENEIERLSNDWNVSSDNLMEQLEEV